MFDIKPSDLVSASLALIQGEPNLVANLANVSSLVFHALPGLNWAGFYIWDRASSELVLGPFQGKPACLRIKPGRGVCGTSFSEKRTILIDDVLSFEGHIACDSDSRSELVVPIIQDQNVVAVLDLDSPMIGRFKSEDKFLLESLAEELAIHLKFTESTNRGAFSPSG